MIAKRKKKRKTTFKQSVHKGELRLEKERGWSTFFSYLQEYYLYCTSSMPKMKNRHMISLESL
jgi:hypothetical protein